MKKHILILLSGIVMSATGANALTLDLKSDREFKLNQFEKPHDSGEFSNVEFGINADLSFYFQNVTDDYNGSSVGTSSPLQAGVSLPTANLDFHARLARGFNVVLQTRLSSHHHNEPYVKGGYAVIESLDFVKPGFLDSVMKNTSIKVGVNDINFGDNHFRRTDNANTMNAVFSINQAVESNLQSVFGEVMYRVPSINSFVLVGVTNGIVNPQDYTKDSGKSRVSGYAKLGFDKQFSDDFRLRITQSMYAQHGPTRATSLFSGTGGTAGSILRGVFGSAATATSVGTYNPLGNLAGDLFVSNTSIFSRFYDTEIFALYEYAGGNINNVVGGADTGGIGMHHFSVEAVQRFWQDKIYLGARYEKLINDHSASFGNGYNGSLDQIQVGAGWHLYNGVLARLEYVYQSRNRIVNANDKIKFSGALLSASVAF